MGEAPLLSIRDLSVQAGGRVLLGGISLKLERGAIVGLSGPSGLGKTRLLRAVAGLDDPAKGSIQLEGRSPEEWGWPEFRRRVLYVSQKPVFLDGTLEENLRRPFLYRSFQDVYPGAEVRGLLEEFLLQESLLEQNARTLSLGQQQRGSLIRGLILRPAVLLLDEPTSALDEEAVARVEAMLRKRCSEEGMAALIVTHDRAQAGRLCDAVHDLVPNGTECTAEAAQ